MTKLALSMMVLVALATCDPVEPRSDDAARDHGGSRDGGSRDGGSRDGGSRDGGSRDGSSRDGGSRDGGSRDGGSRDGSSRDGGSGDAIEIFVASRDALLRQWCVCFASSGHASEAACLDAELTTDEERACLMTEYVSEAHRAYLRCEAERIDGFGECIAGSACDDTVFAACSEAYAAGQESCVGGGASCWP